MLKEDNNFEDANFNEEILTEHENESCPKCNKPLVYDNFLDSMKCLFCGYRHNISQEYDLNERQDDGYAHEDCCGYGDYVEDW